MSQAELLKLSKQLNNLTESEANFVLSQYFKIREKKVLTNESKIKNDWQNILQKARQVRAQEPLKKSLTQTEIDKILYEEIAS